MAGFTGKHVVKGKKGSYIYRDHARYNFCQIQLGRGDTSKFS